MRRKTAGVGGEVIAAALVALAIGLLSCGPEQAPVGKGVSTTPPEDLHPLLGDRADAVLADGIEASVRISASLTERIRELSAAAAATSGADELVIDYPLDGSIFPPHMVPPTFLWHDPDEQADTWLIHIALTDEAGTEFAFRVLVPGPPPPQGEIDPRCLGDTNEIYQPTPYQAAAHSWKPDEKTWAAVQRGSVARPAEITVWGLQSEQPRRMLSIGSLTLTTSDDPIGGTIFYRDVPLMPAAGESGTIQPLSPNMMPLINWRLRDISQRDSHIVLNGMPACANCHSFSEDGKTLAMDVDGPTGDKGAYAITPIAERTVIDKSKVITWNSFPEKPEDHKTIGFLSRISPDGRFVISTVNESLYVRNFTNYKFLQVFYPARGILAYYSKATGRIKALPGADDPDFVHCGAAWTPAGEHLVFSRAAATDPYYEGQENATFANDPNELPMRYDLYRMPFAEGRGGTPVPLEGASDNGMSNTFPKVSPDGKWVVYVRSKNGQLLRPDGRLWIVPAEGGEAREMRCNTSLMNSWHSFSPSGRWMVFSSKANTPYTQMFLTHIDEDGNDSPPVLIPNSTAANRAVNLPEFLNASASALLSIEVPAVNHYRQFARGAELYAAGRFEEAIAACRKVLKSDPDFSRALVMIAQCQIILQRYPEAIASCERAFELAPHDSRARTVISTAYLRTNKPEEAIHHLKRALELNPNDAAAHLYYGQVLHQMQRSAEAIKQFREAVRIDEACTPAHAGLGMVLSEQGRAVDAIRHYAKAVELEPRDVVTREKLALLLSKNRRYEEAKVHFEMLLTHQQAKSKALAYLTINAMAQGDYKSALGTLERAIKAEPRNLGAALARAWLLATCPDDAIRDGEGAAALAQGLCEQTNWREPPFLDTLAAALAEQGRYEEAAAMARRVLAMPGEWPGREGLSGRLRLYSRGKPYRLKPGEQLPGMTPR